MYAVNYHRASSVAEAAKLLKNGDAKALSGGMTLIPAMKVRLAAPSDLVDISAPQGAQGRQGVGQDRHHRRRDHACRGGRRRRS